MNFAVEKPNALQAETLKQLPNAKTGLCCGYRIRNIVPTIFFVLSLRGGDHASV